MSKRILIAKDTKLGNLNNYINLISTLESEFKLHLLAIGETHSDSRDLFVRFNSEDSAIELNFVYEDNELYFNFIAKGNDADKIISRTKELVTN